MKEQLQQKEICRRPRSSASGSSWGTWGSGAACGAGFCGGMDELVFDNGYGHAPWMQDELAPVTLHIYDVGTSLHIRAINGILRRIGTGLFHCGVEVFGSEWSYSDMMGEECGIFCCPPCRCQGFTHVESVFMGRTKLTVAGFRSVIGSMQAQWPSEAYHLVAQNCCHFCEELCVRLGVGKIPHWINHLANSCAMVTTDPAESEDCQKCCAGIRIPQTLFCGSDAEPPMMMHSSGSFCGVLAPGGDRNKRTRPGQHTVVKTVITKDAVLEEDNKEEESLPHREMSALDAWFQGTLDRFKRQGTDDGLFAEQGWQANQCAPVVCPAPTADMQ